MKLFTGKGTNPEVDQTAATALPSPVPQTPGQSWWSKLLRRRQEGDQRERVAWQHGDVLTTRIVHVLLVAALLAGPAALVWLAAGRPSSGVATGAPSAEPVTDPGAIVRASAAAEQVVFFWLTASAADRAELQQLIAAPLPTAMRLPENKPAAPTEMWVGEAEEVAPALFRVVVAAVGGPRGVAHYAVAVMVAGDSAVAATLPAPARRPGDTASATAATPRMTTLAAADAAYSTVAGYVTAYLTGSAQLDRWTSPESGLTAISPRACVRVHVDQVAAPEAAAASPGTQLPVLATATCTAAGGATSTSQYGLRLHLRDGRWEVAAEDPGLLAAANPSAEPAPADLSRITTPSTR